MLRWEESVTKAEDTQTIAYLFSFSIYIKCSETYHNSVSPLFICFIAHLFSENNKQSLLVHFHQGMKETHPVLQALILFC